MRADQPYSVVHLMLDAVLASLHHLLAFALFAIFACEMVLLRPGLGGPALARLARIDGAYGAVALALILVGAARVIWGVRGSEFYVFYWLFWVKMALFLAVGALSVPPTLALARWRKTGTELSGHVVPDGEIADARRWLGRQAPLLALIPVVAAFMARGVGY